METCGDADRVTRTKRSQLAVWTCSQDAPVRSRLLVEMALAGLEAHHRNNSGSVHSTAEARVPSATCPWSKGQLDSKDAASLLSCFTFLSGVFQGATCDGANTLPKWQRETHGGCRIAGR